MKCIPQDEDRIVSGLTEQELCSGIRQACARGKGVFVFQSKRQTWARELTPNREWIAENNDQPVGEMSEQQLCSSIRLACARGQGVLVFQCHGQTWARELVCNTVV
nr:hypothetical protein [uncultured Desulfobulbus sp.]